jgi:tetratricopeptide (TPR) repeat protein
MQIAVVLGAAALLLILYFCCETRPQNIRALEKSRALAAESTNEQILLREAKAGLTPAQESDMMALEQQLASAVDDSARAALLKRLSGQWFSLGHPALAGAYAEQVAELEESDESWSIAGSTYAICLQRAKDDNTVRDFCAGRAVKAFENAISLNPGNLAHQVNMALCFADAPPPDEPMRAVNMLLDLNQRHPDNVLILNALGRLAIRIGQYDRAVERLERSLSLDRNNSNTVCLLSQAYEGLGDVDKARAFASQCEAMRQAQ